MSQRVDFSGNAKVYDQRHAGTIPGDVLRALAEVAELRPGATILDLGAGTGRVAAALATAGCDVVALEPSPAMLSALRFKATGLPVKGIAGEGAHLPFAGACFDGVVLARVLYLMVDWREVVSEAIRVLKVGSPLLHEWGNGSADEEWVQIREHAKRLFQRAGIEQPFHPGARSEAEIDTFLNTSGFRHVGGVQVQGEGVITVGDFLRRIADGEFSYTWEVPPQIQGPCLAELKGWAVKRFGLDRAVPFPREMSWKIYRKDAVIQNAPEGITSA